MGISLRHDTAGIGGGGSGGGGGGGGRGGKYGLDFMLQRQKMAQDMIESDKNRMFQAGMAQQDFQNRNQLARNQFDIQKQMLDFTDNKEQEREKRKAAREDAIDKRRNERRDFEFAADNAESDRRQQLMQSENLTRARRAQAAQYQQSVAGQLRDALKREDLEPEKRKEIQGLVDSIDMVLQPDQFDSMQAEQFMEGLSKRAMPVLSNLPPRDPVGDANRGVQYFDRTKGQYVGSFDPNVPMTVIDKNSGMKMDSPGAQQQQGPLSPEQYFAQNPEEYKKDLANEMARVQEEMEASGNPVDSRAVRREAQARLKQNYMDDQDFVTGRGQAEEDDFSGMMDVLEKGTPEQKAEFLGKMKDSEEMSSLLARAAADDPQATKALDLIEQAVPVKDRVDNWSAKLQSKDMDVRRQTMDRMRRMKDEGVIDDYDYTAAVVKSTGRSSKDLFKQIAESQEGGDVNAVINKRNDALSKLAGDLGMYDSRAYVRAFQSTPKMEDIIKKAAESGKMSRKDAEDYVYKQILAQQFSADLPKLVIDESGMSAKQELDRQKKNQKSLFRGY